MSINDVKLFYGFVCFALCSILVLPTISIFVIIPRGEAFSELWLLGEGHMAEAYPFNVEENETYSVYLGVGNHMGSLKYYRVYGKLRNQSEPLSDSVKGTPSTLPPLFEYHFFAVDDETWERMSAFSFSEVSIGENVSRVSSITVDGNTILVNKTATWDSEGKGYYYQLFFELWLYDTIASDFQFYNRFVGIWLNVTALNAE